MTHRRRNLAALSLLVLLSVLVTACGARPSAPGRFYVLSSPPDLSSQKPSEGTDQDLVIGVGPVTLPPHLDRTQIVTQASRHRLDLKDLDQWAEPLKDGFTRVLAHNLSVLLGTDRVFQFPWRRPFSVRYQLTVDVLRFDTGAHGESVLSARWNLIEGDGRELLYSHTSTFRAQTPGRDIEPIVAAMSENLAELSREIAIALLAI